MNSITQAPLLSEFHAVWVLWAHRQVETKSTAAVSSLTYLDTVSDSACAELWELAMALPSMAPVALGDRAFPLWFGLQASDFHGFDYGWAPHHLG